LEEAMTDYSRGDLDLVEASVYVMPTVPKSLGVDPVLASLLHVMAFLELSGDDVVDPDSAVQAMECVAHYLQGIPADRVDGIRKQIDRVTDRAHRNDWGPEAIDFFANFLENAGVGMEEE
jgi:hypothetical protein